MVASASVLLLVLLVSHDVEVSCGETYDIYASDDWNQENYTCPGGPQDACIFLCDRDMISFELTVEVTLYFHCGKVGDCQFWCIESECGGGEVLLYGQNASNFTVIDTVLSMSDSDHFIPFFGISSGACFSHPKIYAPNSGSLYLNRIGKYATVSAGANTEDIIINCSDNEGIECEYTTINASSAQYLEITVSFGSKLAGSSTAPNEIYCPTNGDPETASCIIDLREGGAMDWTRIYTQHGIPRDVWIKLGAGTINNTIVFCDAGFTSNYGSNYSVCWETRSPTMKPTQPTLEPTMIPSIEPTINPSTEPTINPTTEPTLETTIEPTQPIAIPTDKLSSTQRPTADSSTNPTSITTKDLSTDTTDCVTSTCSSATAKNIATSHPSEDVMPSTTKLPPISTSATWHITDDLGDRESDTNIITARSQSKDLNELYQRVVFFYVGSIFIVASFAFIDATIIHINDYLRIGALMTFALQTLDMFSDCFFVTQIHIYIKNQIDDRTIVIIGHEMTLVLAICFIVLPATISLIQLHIYVRKQWVNDDRVREWILSFSKLLLALSIITGSSFAAVSLLNSSIFKMNVFDMGLTNRKLRAFGTQRLYSVVLMENVPQLILQYIYIASLNHVNDPIVISSIILSLMSIIVTILSVSWERSIYNTQTYVVISMNITGDSVSTHASKCRTMRKKLPIAIAALFNVYVTTIEILKPNHIAKGLSLTINVYVNEKGVNYKQMLIDANESGELQQIFQQHWELCSSPFIGSIETKTVPSISRQASAEANADEHIQMNDIDIEY